MSEKTIILLVLAGAVAFYAFRSSGSVSAPAAAPSAPAAPLTAGNIFDQVLRTVADVSGAIEAGFQASARTT